MVCVSRELESQLKDRRPGGTVVERIGCGVPVPPRTVTRLKEVLRVGYVGRLAEEQKRISEVTEAFCRVAREISDVECVLYGDGPERSVVERLLASKGANLPVRLAGRIDSQHIQEHLLECDVIVLLSDYEGLPIALMEGMACGCVPVCLEMRSGIPELVEHETTGLLVKDRGQGFVAAIRRLHEEPGLWERLSAGARARIEAGHSSEASADRWAELIRKLHADAVERRPIRLPRRLGLSPVHPALASADVRRVGPPPFVRWYRRSRIAAGRWRRKLLGQPIP
jgi:glycosyltransferase involved in cell wall biosynthesis